MSTSSPKRRRRRFVITIAVLTLSLAWCYWPRGDVRFVGKWAALDNLYHREEVIAGRMQRYPVMILTSSGYGTITFPPDWYPPEWNVEADITFRWAVQNGKFFTASSDWPLLAELELAYFRMTATRLGIARLNESFIIKATPSEFVLDYYDAWDGDEEWRSHKEGPPCDFYIRINE